MNNDTKLKEGVHYGLGMGDYHAWKIDKENLIEGPISCSLLKDFDVNPYAWLKSPERKQTDAMRKGSLFDAALTDPDALDSLIAYPEPLTPCVILPFDSLRTKAAKEWKQEQANAGNRVLTQKEYDKEQADHLEALENAQDERNNAEKAADEVRNHPIAADILDGAEFQVGIVGEYGGIPTKCLFDILPGECGKYPETVYDYKTISTGLDDESIRKAIGNFKYHWQAGFYKTMVNKFTDRVCEDFGFIFQCVHTLEVRVVMLDEDALMLGTRAVGQAMRRFMKCAHKGIQSRYLKSADDVKLMPYQEMNETEQLEQRELNQ